MTPEHKSLFFLRHPVYLTAELLLLVRPAVQQSNLFVSCENLLLSVVVSSLCLSQQSALISMEKQPAEYWIKHLGLVEHPGKEDGYFAVPFEDTFSVRNRKQVKSRTRWPQ